MPFLTRSIRSPWFWAFVAVAAAAGPPFASMELHSDAILFDIYARNLQRGGVAYRDWCETNLPGMAWLHLAARVIGGWDTRWLRALDGFVVLGSLTLISCWFPDNHKWRRWALVLALFIFYLALSEWCHVQRDPWMLLPSLGALYLRRAQVQRRAEPMRAVCLCGFIEGLLWAAAFWIKPFVAVPGLLVWLVSARLELRTAHGSYRWVLINGLAVFVGGLAAGAIGITWMIVSGAWPHFWEMATVWNREYFSFDVTQGQRWLLTAGMLVRLSPWVLVHLVAVPLAVRHLFAARQLEQALMAALYLGWLIQAVALQHLFDYVHVPPIMLGFAVVSGEIARTDRSWARATWLLLLVLCLSTRIPVLIDRAQAFWSERNSALLRDRLSGLHKVNWVELGNVSDFLRREGIRDGELTSFQMPTAALYRELDVEAATRYHFFQNNYLTFRSQRERIRNELSASKQRFVVCDLLYYGIALEKPDPSLLPPRWNPWHSRIVYQSGRYVVLAISGPEMRDWLHSCFEW